MTILSVVTCSFLGPSTRRKCSFTAWNPGLYIQWCGSVPGWSARSVLTIDCVAHALRVRIRHLVDENMHSHLVLKVPILWHRQNDVCALQVCMSITLLRAEAYKKGMSPSSSSIAWRLCACHNRLASAIALALALARGSHILSLGAGWLLVDLESKGFEVSNFDL